MQNIIYFQSQYARKVPFDQAAPALLSIFEKSTDEAYGSWHPSPYMQLAQNGA